MDFEIIYLFIYLETNGKNAFAKKHTILKVQRDQGKTNPSQPKPKVYQE
jgi:hypothetical protein